MPLLIYFSRAIVRFVNEPPTSTMFLLPVFPALMKPPGSGVPAVNFVEWVWMGWSTPALTCKNCRERTPLFLGGRSMFHLNPAGRSLIHQIKYQGNKRVLEDIPFFLKRAPGFLDFITGTVLIPVPLHRKKLNKRTYNQSLWIAQALAKEAGISTVAYDCLIRTRHTPSQTKLDREQRRKNMKNAFALKQGTCLDGFNRAVLVDDVYTTGATLDACAQALIESGFGQVEVATLGHG